MPVNALFIVEGHKTERNIVEKLIAKVLEDSQIQVHPVSVCGNIHMLYKELIEMGGAGDIREVLASMKSMSEEDRRLLKSDLRFAYTYLIFDLEPQHDFYHHGKLMAKDVQQNLEHVREMLNYFNNETDGTIGKLYINYPMVESFRDHNKDLKDYLERKVSLEDCNRYKKIVNGRGDNRNFSKYSTEDIQRLISFNLKKMGYLTNGSTTYSYDSYVRQITQLSVFSAEKKMISEENNVDVLNTMMVLPVDYKGRQLFETVM